MNSLKFLEPEKQTERRTGELQSKARPMKSSMFPSAHQSHPYSQKLNLQLHRKVPLFIIWAAASLLFPKSLNLQQGRLGPGDSAKQTHNCGNRLVQNISNSSTHIMNTLCRCADKRPSCTIALSCTQVLLHTHYCVQNYFGNFPYG